VISTAASSRNGAPKPIQAPLLKPSPSSGRPLEGKAHFALAGRLDGLGQGGAVGGESLGAVPQRDPDLAIATAQVGDHDREFRFLQSFQHAGGMRDCEGAEQYAGSMAQDRSRNFHGVFIAK